MLWRFLFVLVASVLLFAQQPLDRAWQLAANGQRQEAVQVLRTFIKTNPDNADARLLQGMSTSWHEIPGADHFSILDEMEAGDGQITKVLRDLRAAAGL